jgi:hypothetical protein
LPCARPAGTKITSAHNEMMIKYFFGSTFFS